MDKEEIILEQDADQLGHYKDFDFYSEWSGSPESVSSIDLLSAFNEITLVAVLETEERGTRLEIGKSISSLLHCSCEKLETT